MRGQYAGICRVNYGSASHTIINLSIVPVNTFSSIASLLVWISEDTIDNQFLLSGLCPKHNKSHVRTIEHTKSNLCSFQAIRAQLCKSHWRNETQTLIGNKDFSML